MAHYGAPTMPSYEAAPPAYQPSYQQQPPAGYPTAPPRPVSGPHQQAASYPPPPPANSYHGHPAPAAGISYEASYYPQKPGPEYAPPTTGYPAPSPYCASAPPGSFPHYQYAAGTQQQQAGATAGPASMPSMPTYQPIIINNTTTTTTTTAGPQQPQPTATTIITVDDQKRKNKEAQKAALFSLLFVLGFFSMGITWLFLWVPLLL